MTSALGKRVGEEVNRPDRHAVGEPGSRDLAGGDGGSGWQVCRDAPHVRVRLRDEDGKQAVCTAHVAERLVAREIELGSEGFEIAHRDPGHCLHELLEPFRLAVQLFEHRGPTVLGFVLRLAGSERLREVAPEGIQAGVGHFQEAAHVVGAVFVKEGRRFTRVAVSRIGAVAVALEKTERDQRVKEIGIRAAMQAERVLELAPVIVPPPKRVNSPSSTAERSVFAGQKAIPTSMMRAGVNDSKATSSRQHPLTRVWVTAGALDRISHARNWRLEKAWSTPKFSESGVESRVAGLSISRLAAMRALEYASGTSNRDVQRNTAEAGRQESAAPSGRGWREAQGRTWRGQGAGTIDGGVLITRWHEARKGVPNRSSARAAEDRTFPPPLDRASDSAFHPRVFRRARADPGARSAESPTMPRLRRGHCHFVPDAPRIRYPCSRISAFPASPWHDEYRAPAGPQHRFGVNTCGFEGDLRLVLQDLEAR